MAEELGDKDQSSDDMAKELRHARGLLSEPGKAELGILVQSQEEKEVEAPSLIGVLGKKGERWSQDVIEIGMELMEKGLSARPTIIMESKWR
jgi:hypothetical protein